MSCADCRLGIVLCRPGDLAGMAALSRFLTSNEKCFVVPVSLSTSGVIGFAP
jgi:hypothetical protein